MRKRGGREEERREEERREDGAMGRMLPVSQLVPEAPHGPELHPRVLLWDPFLHGPCGCLHFLTIGASLPPFAGLSCLQPGLPRAAGSVLTAAASWGAGVAIGKRLEIWRTRLPGIL